MVAAGLAEVISKISGRALGYSVYVHWPYCNKICSYCNFNKYRQPETTDDESLRRSLVKEVTTLLEHAHFPPVTSVYFGGGTPSLAPPTTIYGVLEAIRGVAGLLSDTEVTLEVNPTMDVLDKLAEFRDAGINRLSVGVQSLDNHMLSHIMGRDHTGSHARHVMERARLLFPRRVSSDLMFGLPEQTTSDWHHQLSSILATTDGHASLYQLTIERGTPLATELDKGVWLKPSDDTIAEMYEMAIVFLQERGFFRYEISNFAQANCQSVHNINYWLGGSYIGVGPGAHSRYHDPACNAWRRTINALTPHQWMHQVLSGGSGVKDRRFVEQRERFEEVVMTSLRTSYGLHKEVCEKFDIEWSTFVSLLQTDCGDLFSNNLLQVDSHHLVATDKGLNVIDSILVNILVCLDKLIEE